MTEPIIHTAQPRRLHSPHPSRLRQLGSEAMAAARCNINVSLTQQEEKDVESPLESTTKGSPKSNSTRRPFYMNHKQRRTFHQVSEASVLAGRVASLLVMSKAVDDWSVTTNSITDDERNDKDNQGQQICADCVARFASASPVDYSTKNMYPALLLPPEETSPSAAVSDVRNFSSSSGETTGSVNASRHQQSKSQSSKESEDNVYPPALTPLTPPTPAAPVLEQNRWADLPQSRPSPSFQPLEASPQECPFEISPTINVSPFAQFTESPPKSVGSDLSSVIQYDQINVDSHSNIRAIKTDRKRHLSRLMADAVLTNPISLRSYCQMAHETVQKSRLKRREICAPDIAQLSLVTDRQVKEENEVEPPRAPSKCSNCHHRILKKSPLPSQAQAVLRSQSHYHKRFRVAKQNVLEHLIHVLVDAILDKIPHISITLQAVSDVTEYNVTIAVSLCHLASSSVFSILSALAKVLGQLQTILMDSLSFLNPRVAVDITTEVLASGIQSVTEGVGSTRKSASAAIHHYLSRGSADAGGILSRGAPLANGNMSVKTSVPGLGGCNSRSSSRGAAFLLGIPGVVQVSQALAGTRHNIKNDPANKVLSEKLFKKLNKIDSTSKVISYLERQEEALSSRAKQRVQRMMHYEISLRPFTATVVIPSRETLLNSKVDLASPSKTHRRAGLTNSTEDMMKVLDNDAFENVDLLRSRASSMTALPSVDDDRKMPAVSENNETSGLFEGHVVSPDFASMRAIMNQAEAEDATLHSSTSDHESEETETMDGESTPFLCTPKSFPPTPGSRFMVMARGSRFAEDVVFFAREHLRLQDGLASSNARTRSVAMALRDGRRLAVFSAEDAGQNISLTCGQHCATKIGNVLYCTTRCMVPVLRNCYVYFEMSVANPMVQQTSLSSLSIGLSTPEMPSNTLVGAWKSSIGLLTTGQILAAGQWYSPCDSRLSMYGNSSTVGCLVLLDDSGMFETWDGMMVPALVTFNVDGNVVLPPPYLPPHLGGIGGVLGGAVGNPSMMMMGMGMGMSHMGTGLENEDAAAAAMASNTSFPLYVPREEDLYATLTLHSPATQVMCRFCAEDVVACTRESIGAPPGVTVYAVDGSVLFEQSENLRT